jgi:deoxyribonuclease IV
MNVYTKLNFGTAGIPLSTPDRNILNGIKHVDRLGLDGLEIEFVRSVNIGEEKAILVKEAAKKFGIELTCHGQYYINLSSLEDNKVKDSVGRVLNAATIANLCGAKSMTFHAGFYMKQDERAVYDKIKRQIKEIVQRLEEDSNPILIRPETTGKGTQFGTVKEIVDLSQEFTQVMPCIDFSHLHARSGGKMNTAEEFDDVFEAIEKGLGKEGLRNMHCHVSGINYSDKGERNHLVLKESDFNYKDLMKSFKKFNAKGIVISESPNIEVDALLMKKEFNKL